MGGMCALRSARRSVVLLLALLAAVAILVASGPTTRADAAPKAGESRISVPLYSAGAASDGKALYLSRVGFSGPGLVNAYSIPEGVLLRQNSVYPGMLFDLEADPQRDRIFAADGWGVHVYRGSDMSYLTYLDVGASIADMAFEPRSGRLFVGVRGLNVAGDRAVLVMDPTSGARVAEIATGAVYATNLAVDTDRGAVLVGEHGRIRIFDGATLAVLADITSPLAASDSFYAVDGDTIYVAGKRTEVVTAIDAASGETLASQTIGRASALALSPKGPFLWVAHRAASAGCEEIALTCPYVVSKLNVKNMRVQWTGSEALLDYPYPQYHRLTLVGRKVVFTAFRSEEALVY